MKKLITAALVTTALLTGTLAYSDDATPRRATREISINPGYHKIIAGNDIQLVLVQDPAKSSVVIKGDKNLVDLVNVSIEKGVLSINSKKNLKGRRIKIFVPVTALTALEIGNGTSVTTLGVVKLDDLKVTVQDGSIVDLHVIGNVHVEAGTNCDFVYETYEKSKVMDEQE